MNSSNLELKIALGIMGATCIVGVLYWLYRRWRVKKPKQEPPK
jgi:predicted permease